MHRESEEVVETMESNQNYSGDDSSLSFAPSGGSSLKDNDMQDIQHLLSLAAMLQEALDNICRGEAISAEAYFEVTRELAKYASLPKPDEDLYIGDPSILRDIGPDDLDPYENPPIASDVKRNTVFEDGDLQGPELAAADFDTKDDGQQGGDKSTKCTSVIKQTVKGENKSKGDIEKWSKFAYDLNKSVDEKLGPYEQPAGIGCIYRFVVYLKKHETTEEMKYTFPDPQYRRMSKLLDDYGSSGIEADIRTLRFIMLLILTVVKPARGGAGETKGYRRKRPEKRKRSESW